MRRIGILMMALFAGAVMVGWWLSRDSGYVLVAFSGWTLESTVWVAAGLLVTLFVAVYVGLRLLINILAPTGLVSTWLRGRRQRLVGDQTRRGLLCYLEGDWERSRRLLLRAAERSDQPQLNYLVAAKASQALGDGQQSQQYLHQAENSQGGADLAIGLTQVELHLAQGQLEQALAILTRLKRRHAKQAQLNRQLVRVYRELNDWQSLSRLLPTLGKILGESELNRLQQEVYVSLFAQVKKSGTAKLAEAWNSLPKEAQKQSDVIAAYARALLGSDAEAEAEKLLRSALKRDWNHELVHLYGLLQGSEADKQLLQAESWLPARPNNVVLLLSLGRLALRAHQWDKAREYLEACLAQESLPEARAELGRLLASQGDPGRAVLYLQQALAAHIPLPELPQPGRS